MPLKIGVTARIYEYIKEGVVVGPGNVQYCDVTLMLPDDDGLWVDRAYRRLRPFFCKDLEHAKSVYEKLRNSRGAHSGSREPRSDSAPDDS